jgi:hypothetical protein
MKKLVTLIFLTFLVFDAHAYRGNVPEWNSLEVQTVVDNFPIKVAATTSKDRLTSLTVTMQGKHIVVSPQEFSDLLRPQLTTLRVVSPDVKYLPGPTFFVELSFESGDLSGAPPSSVSFQFYSQKYMGREIVHHRLASESKLPGQPPKKHEPIQPQ